MMRQRPQQKLSLCMNIHVLDVKNRPNKFRVLWSGNPLPSPPPPPSPGQWPAEDQSAGSVGWARSTRKATLSNLAAKAMGDTGKEGKYE